MYCIVHVSIFAQSVISNQPKHIFMEQREIDCKRAEAVHKLLTSHEAKDYLHLITYAMPKYFASELYADTEDREREAEVLRFADLMAFFHQLQTIGRAKSLQS